jgi:hypothetical protein
MYGEVRGESPAGGGPVASFYWPPLHRFIRYADAAALVSSMSPAEYVQRVCNCDICATLASEPSGLLAYFRANRPGNATRDFPERSSLELNRFHFLFARRQELEDLRLAALPEIAESMLKVAEEYSDSSRDRVRAWVARLQAA